MGALKPWHIAVLVVVLILLFGAKRLPDAARPIGRTRRSLPARWVTVPWRDHRDRPRLSARSIPGLVLGCAPRPRVA